MCSKGLLLRVSKFVFIFSFFFFLRSLLWINRRIVDRQYSLSADRGRLTIMKSYVNHFKRTLTE